MSQILQETPAETMDRCAKHSAEWIADRVEFKPSGVDAPRTVAKALFARHNFADYIETDPKPETVLKAAGRSGHSPAGYITRKFVSPNNDTPVAIHVTRVTGDDESGDRYTCLARVRIGHRVDPHTGTQVPFAVARPPEGKTEFASTAARERAMWIASEANYKLGNVKNADVAEALRKAIESTGAVKSLGGGNNYYVAPVVAERIHNFLTEVQDKLGIYYVRDPKTTLGATHTATVVAQAAQSSLEDDLKGMEDELAKAIDTAKNPHLTKKGKPVSKKGMLTRKVETMRSIGAKLNMYEHVIEKRLTERLSGIREKMEKHFETLLDGGSVLWSPELSDDKAATPPSSDVEPAPTTERSPGSEAPMAAASDDADPFSWV